MIRICPSILNANLDDLPGEIEKVAATADLIHLDVMDNVFVPNFTFSPERTREIIESSTLPIDVHLMVADVDKKVEQYSSKNAISMTVHFEACQDPLATLKQIRTLGKRAGLAIKPNTPIEVVEELLPEIDMIVVMTVEPGFGGQSFMASLMPKVEKARRYLEQRGLQDVWIQIDGGISPSTIEIARRAGADTFVAGSAVYKSENPSKMVEQLRLLASRC
ncbi:MAG: ribulose-phosphate 3-epimerase [Actinobacteria bacterium]|nr:ribulose-phosphate 3-epimerase [Actinomycetota bacterium]NBY50186.1 ribulose-phosphate 3-epimerase [Actinomycetota bacterium]NCY10443.1 ribulose-phosphate 3-epimerase [Actinomycetota bacterium]NDA35780.1 ribulose-phosphate 3-epimerase [Actinomycetota bacterium]NDE49465.1 ribulose-phosphate 3-epimerase [Actinomycetota bacterium]